MLDELKETGTLGRGEVQMCEREAEIRRSRKSPYHHLNLGAVEWAELMLACKLSKPTLRKMRREREAFLGAKKRGARGAKNISTKRRLRREKKREVRRLRGSDEQSIRAVYKRCCRNWKTKASEWMSEREFEELARRVPLLDGDPFWIAKGRRVWFRRKDPSEGFVRDNVEVLIDREVVDLL